MPRNTLTDHAALYPTSPYTPVMVHTAEEIDAVEQCLRIYSLRPGDTINLTDESIRIVQQHIHRTRAVRAQANPPVIQRYEITNDEMVPVGDTLGQQIAWRDMAGAPSNRPIPHPINTISAEQMRSLRARIDRAYNAPEPPAHSDELVSARIRQDFFVNGNVAGGSTPGGRIMPPPTARAQPRRANPVPHFEDFSVVEEGEEAVSSTRRRRLKAAEKWWKVDEMPLP